MAEVALESVRARVGESFPHRSMTPLHLCVCDVRSGLRCVKHVTHTSAFCPCLVLQVQVWTSGSSAESAVGAELCCGEAAKQEVQQAHPAYAGSSSKWADPCCLCIENLVFTDTLDRNWWIYDIYWFILLLACSAFRPPSASGFYVS